MLSHNESTHFNNPTAPHRGRRCLRRWGWPLCRLSGLGGSFHLVTNHPSRLQRMRCLPASTEVWVLMEVLLRNGSAARDHRPCPSRLPSGHPEVPTAGGCPRIYKSRSLGLEGRIAQLLSWAPQGPTGEYGGQISHPALGPAVSLVPQPAAGSGMWPWTLAAWGFPGWSS